MSCRAACKLFTPRLYDFYKISNIVENAMCDIFIYIYSFILSHINVRFLSYNASIILQRVSRDSSVVIIYQHICFAGEDQCKWGMSWNIFSHLSVYCHCGASFM